jgi:hypothetical protein
MDPQIIFNGDAEQAPFVVGKEPSIVTHVDKDESLSSDSNASEPRTPVDQVEFLAQTAIEGLQHEGAPEVPEVKTPTMKTQDEPRFLTLNHVASTVDMPMSGATKLRKMIFETNELIVCPGVYDGLSARTALEVGFSAMYMVSLIH